MRLFFLVGGSIFFKREIEVNISKTFRILFNRFLEQIQGPKKKCFCLFQKISLDELDRLLGIVVDVENLFMCVHKEEDADTKQVQLVTLKLLIRS